ncbi:MAG: divalent-cation tolerance protein CutA [Pirellulales bacterium]
MVDAATTEPIVEISTTFGRREAADACAERLVERRLAACVQIDGPVRSTYRWHGVVETAEEWRCVCKTTADRRAECLVAIAGLHDYEIPQLIVTDVAASAAYAAWVRESVAPPR